MLQPPATPLAKLIRKFNQKIQAFKRDLNLIHSYGILGAIYSPTFFAKYFSFLQKENQ